MQYLYLLSILASFACLVLVDWRYQLAFWASSADGKERKGLTLFALLLPVGWLLCWDLAGINLGIFFKGAGPWQSGLMIAPELPVEELAFLSFLSYLTLLIYRFACIQQSKLPLMKLSAVGFVLLFLDLVLSSAPQLNQASAYTYLLLNLVFLTPVIAWFYWRQRKLSGALPSAPILFTFASVSLLTAIFDPLLIHFQIVGYDWSKTSGLLLNIAPLEDFFYPLATALLIPSTLGTKDRPNEF